LFKANVNDVVGGLLGVVVVVVAVLVVDDSGNVTFVPDDKEDIEFDIPYARDKDTSAGAIVKSISFFFPRVDEDDKDDNPPKEDEDEAASVVDAVSLVVVVVAVVVGLPATTVRLALLLPPSFSIGGCSMSAPGTVPYRRKVL
jgi:hypothetical protein